MSLTSLIQLSKLSYKNQRDNYYEKNESIKSETLDNLEIVKDVLRTDKLDHKLFIHPENIKVAN